VYHPAADKPEFCVIKIKKMKTQIDSLPWGTRCLSFWLTLILALGIIFIGIRFIAAPQTGAAGFGISFTNMNDAVYGQIKGVRDIFSGVLLLVLLWLRLRKATAIVFTTSIIVPAGDFTIILSHNGPVDIGHLLIHGGTVVVMIITSVLLFRKS
jgi:hypothetical protein